jgi:hypothetical protein
MMRRAGRVASDERGRPCVPEVYRIWLLLGLVSFLAWRPTQGV